MYYYGIIIYSDMQDVKITNESDLGDQIFPSCVCPYVVKGKYMLAEMNTGRYKGISRIVSEQYDDYESLMHVCDSVKLSHRLLRTHIIMNDVK